MKQKRKNLKRAIRRTTGLRELFPDWETPDPSYTSSTGTMNTDSTTAFTNTDCCANPYVNKQQTQETKTNMKKILMEVLTAGASLYLIALAYHVVTASFHIADIKLVHYAVVGYLTVKATAFLRK